MQSFAALVKEQLKTDPFSGVIFCFRAKRARPRHPNWKGAKRKGTRWKAVAAYV